MSDSNGYIVDENGIDYKVIKEIKEVKLSLIHICLSGGKVDAAGGRWPDSSGRHLRSVRYCHPLTVERAAIADIHRVVTVGQRQVGAGLARSGVNGCLLYTSRCV